MNLKCLYFEEAPYKNCKTCCGYDMDCPSYDIGDVELAHPEGESTGLERLFRPGNNNKKMKGGEE